MGYDPDGNFAAAYQLFRRTGAVVWAKRVAAEMRSRGMRPARARRSAQAAFSETEKQLIQLVRQGMTNREISAVLHYSPKTVEAYLSGLYRKTGTASRYELIAAGAGDMPGTGWPGAVYQEAASTVALLSGPSADVTGK